MADPSHEALIPLFLRRVRENTVGPYRIYASVNHLSDRQRRLVGEEPDLKAVHCDIGLVERGRIEHATLLEALRAQARVDGAGYFVTMHLDSFPIRRGWDRRLRHALSAGNRFAAIVPQGYSACLFWDASFEEPMRLPLLVAERERSGPPFAAFQAAFPDYDHIETGLNFLYQAWRRGWRWLPLEPTGHQIYGDAIFHLVGGVRLTAPGEGRLRQSPALAAIRPLATPAFRRLPRRARDRIREWFVDEEATVRDGTRCSKRQELAALLEDPEAYLAACRSVQVLEETTAAS